METIEILTATDVQLLDWKDAYQILSREVPDQPRKRLYEYNAQCIDVEINNRRTNEEGKKHEKRNTWSQ